MTNTLNMTTRRTSISPSPEARDRDSIPVLVVLLGPARDFLIALAVLAVSILAAMLFAFLAYG